MLASPCTRRRSLARLAALACSTAAARSALAQASSSVAFEAPMQSEAPLQTTLVKTGLYLISGGGGNVLLRLSASGAVIVNGKQAGMYPALRAQVRRIARLTDLPIRVLLLTDTAQRQAGNQALFAADRVATLVQEEGRALLPAPQPVSADAAHTPAAVIGFDRDYDLRIGGVEVRMIRVGPLFTPADAVVFFPDLRVLAVGELYPSDPAAASAPDRAVLARWRQAVAQALQLDFDLMIPAGGPPRPRSDLENLLTRLDAWASGSPAG